MSRLVKTHSHFLHLLHKTDAKQRKALFKTISDSQLRAVCEIVLNIYKGTIPVSKAFVDKLRPYRTVLSSLSSRSDTHRRKRILLYRNQKLLPLLLRPILKYLNVAGNDTDTQNEVRSSDDEDETYGQ